MLPTRSSRATIEIEIKVTNLWVNRMIGDQQPWALKKYAFADFTPYKADSPLLPSGLLGPVHIVVSDGAMTSLRARSRSNSRPVEVTGR